MLQLSGRLALFSRYRHPRFRAARYARVVRLEGRAVVPVARSHVIRRVGRPIVRESKPEPEAAMSFEVVSLEVAPLGAVSLEAMVTECSTAVMASETVTANACGQAGGADGEHDRQCTERCERNLFRMYKVFHGDASFFLQYVGWLPRQEDSPRPVAGALSTANVFAQSLQSDFLPNPASERSRPCAPHERGGEAIDHERAITERD